MSFYANKQLLKLEDVQSLLCKDSEAQTLIRTVQKIRNIVVSLKEQTIIVSAQATELSAKLEIAPIEDQLWFDKQIEEKEAMSCVDHNPTRKSDTDSDSVGRTGKRHYWLYCITHCQDRSSENVSVNPEMITDSNFYSWSIPW